ncbi:hypothetical protein FA95DRAFT_729894 [Auriscalpium vulgare]|uniref:Uncharacterized protein n=1 Tax=Auriscalpium vulgare TaxID=40419 RepID=A0ACB8SBP8_9AGAM|nr:hypothetical protein FA95DRAFT_729894 [Auriscalpium vulgare]
MRRGVRTTRAVQAGGTRTWECAHPDPAVYVCLPAPGDITAAAKCLSLQLPHSTALLLPPPPPPQLPVRAPPVAPPDPPSSPPPTPPPPRAHRTPTPVSRAPPRAPARPDMSEDSKSIAPRSRRAHRPILVVANPSPDSDSDDNRPSRSFSSHRYYPYNQPSPIAPSPSRDKNIFMTSTYREPGALTTTNLPSHTRQHPASQSNPALSSPSGTSSPPPSTPGQPVPPMDLLGESTSRKDFASYSSEALLQQQQPASAVPSRAGNFFGKLKSHIPRPHLSHDRRLSGGSRPATVSSPQCFLCPSCVDNRSVSHHYHTVGAIQRSCHRRHANTSGRQDLDFCYRGLRAVLHC